MGSTFSRRTLFGLAGGLASVAAVGLTPSRLAEGPRPNRPASAAVTAESLATDPAALAIPLTSIPGYRPPAVVGTGSYRRPLTGPLGTLSWRDAPGGDIAWQVYDQRDRPLADAGTGGPTAFGSAASYTRVPGVLTFRGNHERSAPAYGVADIRRKRLEVVWSQADGVSHSYGSVFPGTGWTGQPLLVQWPKATKSAMGLTAAQVNDPGFVEVIQPAFDGKIYRLDLATGAQTRPPIVASGGFKGTGSIDPRGYPMLYAGQGLNDNDGTLVPWGFKAYDLITNKEVWRLNGQDAVSHRPSWGAFDSSCLINAATDTLVEPAENGIVYKVQLNSRFDPVAKTMSIDPQVTKMVYRSTLSNQYGVESSAAAYRNLLYATDNDGTLLCWDATGLEIVWALDVGDNDDSTLSIEETAAGAFLYNANSVGWRGANRAGMVTNIRKIDALTGQVMWQHDVPCYYNDAVKGGCESTPLVGRGEIGDLVLFTVAKTTSQAEGEIMALDKATGRVVWDRHLDHYAWSSPVALTGTDGHQYVVFGDSGGLFHLIDPNTGEEYDAISLGGNVEASASAFGNMIVVGSYAQRIYGIRVS